MAQELSVDQYKQLVQEQSQRLLDYLTAVSAGEAELKPEPPEGLEIFADLVPGLRRLIDELRLTQRRYVRQEWSSYAEAGLVGDDILPDSWTPVMETAVLQEQTTLHSNGETTLAVPVRYADEIIGVLGFGSDEPEITWGEDEFTAVEAIVEQVGLALENQRLFDQTQAALSESSSLYEASAAMNAAQTYDEILAVIRRYTIVGAGATNVSLNYFDRPWTSSDRPDWINVLARFSQLPAESVLPRYKLADFPIATQLLTPRSPTIFEDLENTAGLDEQSRALYLQQFQAKATIFVPLVAGGQWVGYINAIYPKPTHFPEADVRRLMSLTGQAAVTLQNLISVAESKARADELAILNEMSRAFAVMLDPVEILHSVHRYARRLMNADSFFIALYDSQNKQISYPFVLDNGEPVNIPPRPFGDGLTEYVIKTSMPVFIEKDMAGWMAQHEIALIGDMAESWMGIPMISGRQVIGVIGAQHEESNHYDRNHLNLLSAVASQATIAYQNARLFQQTQARAQREQMLREITARVRSSADVDTIMKTAVQEIGQALGRRTFIQLSPQAATDDPQPGSAQ